MSDTTIHYIEEDAIMAETAEARKKRLTRNKENCKKVKPDQIGVCRFIEINVQTFGQDISGKWIRTGMTTERGLQFENRIKLIDGRIMYLNKSGASIVTTYQGIPTWATNELRDTFVDYDMFDVPVNF